MSWGAVAVAGATLVGGLISSQGAKDAADKSVEGSRTAIDEQRRARESFEQRTDPFREFGLSAQSELASLLGLPQPVSQQERDLQAQLERLDQTIAAGPPKKKKKRRGGGLFGGALGGLAGGLLGDPVTGSIVGDLRGRGSDTVTGPFDLEALQAERGDLQSQLEGLEADRLAQSNQPASQDALLAQANPLVSFLRDEGFEDIQESAAAQGRLRSGGTLEDLTRFNTNIAATVVPQLQQQRFNQLFNVLGLGANTATGQGTAGLQTATNIGNLQQSIGQTQGQAAINQSNIAGQGISDLAGLFGAFQGGAFGTQTPPPSGLGSSGSFGAGQGGSLTGITNPSLSAGFA